MTTNAWDYASQLADKHANQGGIFIRLSQNGDKIIGAFCGEPFAREVVWTGERYETFDPDNHVGKRPSLRVMLNFFVPSEGEMKVFEGSTAWFKDVLKVRDKYGLEKWLFEVERHGDAGDPKTTYSILPEEQIPPEIKATIAATELHDLADLNHGDEPGDKRSRPQAPTQPTNTARPRATGPINPRQGSEIVARLKALPRSYVAAFLDEFGIQRVRELQAQDLQAAHNLLDSYDREVKGQADSAAIDPFA